jgi:sugar/nucleoside kinase (ribokinase family)
MALTSAKMSDELKIVTTVSNEAEAEMVGERLSEEGIRFTVRLASGGIRLGAAAARDMYVEERDLERALEALEADEGFSDEELARLSEEAGRAANDETA